MEQNHDAEITARLQVVAARAHRPLSAAELAFVRERIESDLRHRDELRGLPLANGDAPDPAFNPADTPAGGRPW